MKARSQHRNKAVLNHTQLFGTHKTLYTSTHQGKKKKHNRNISYQLPKSQSPKQKQTRPPNQTGAYVFSPTQQPVLLSQDPSNVKNQFSFHFQIVQNQNENKAFPSKKSQPQPYSFLNKQTIQDYLKWKKGTRKSGSRQRTKDRLFSQGSRGKSIDNEKRTRNVVQDFLNKNSNATKVKAVAPKIRGLNDSRRSRQRQHPRTQTIQTVLKSKNKSQRRKSKHKMSLDNTLDFSLKSHSQSRNPRHHHITQHNKHDFSAKKDSLFEPSITAHASSVRPPEPK